MITGRLPCMTIRAPFANINLGSACQTNRRARLMFRGLQDLRFISYLGGERPMGRLKIELPTPITEEAVALQSDPCIVWLNTLHSCNLVIMKTGMQYHLAAIIREIGLLSQVQQFHGFGWGATQRFRSMKVP